MKRKILLLLSFFLLQYLSSFFYIKQAHADLIQDIFLELSTGGSSRFPNAQLDDDGELPAQTNFCPVCPVGANISYKKGDQSTSPPLPGCFTINNDGSTNRVNAVTALDCGKYSTYKYCADSSEDFEVPSTRLDGCCKNSDGTDCTKTPDDPNITPAPETEKCPVCPEGTFWTTRAGMPGCYYPQNDPDHIPTVSEERNNNGPACPAGKTCDRTYYTGCKTDSELDDLENNPPDSGPCSSDSDCKDPIKKFCVPNEKGIRTCTDIEIGYASLACTRAHAGTLDFECRTAIGTITASPEAFVKTALAFFLGISGGILLILLILNGFKLMVSGGDPEKIKDAREGIIAAISGLFLIIFSLSVLALITSTILDIPGFG